MAQFCRSQGSCEKQTMRNASVPMRERLVGEVGDLQSKLILLVGSGKTRLLCALSTNSDRS
jgi:hypothetical protein